MTRLGDTKTRINARDLSVRSRQKVIENFGIEITRRITDFEGAALDYDALDPVFYFPIWGLPISRNSVSLTVHQGGNDIDINIVDAIATEGMLSNRNAEIDYARGLIRFETPPDDAEATQITATWKRDYRYKRPDFLVRQTLKNTGVQDTLQISDDTNARFAIEQALLRHSTDPVFSSHGRPFFQREGIARWLKYNPDADKWLMSIDTRLVEYDEYQDEYTDISTVPENTAIDEVPPGDYGELISDEQLSVTTSQAFEYTADRIYQGVGGTAPEVQIYSHSGELLETISLGTFSFWNVNTQSGSTASVAVFSISVRGNFMFVMYSYRYNLAGNNARTRAFIRKYDLSTNQSVKQFTVSTRVNGLGRTDHPVWGMSASHDGVYVGLVYSGGIWFLDDEGDGDSTRNILLNDNTYAEGLDVGTDYVFVSMRRGHDGTGGDFMRLFTFAGIERTSLQFELEDDTENFTVTNTRLYANTGEIYRISQPGNYHAFIPIQFDTHDFDSIYCLTTNTSKGDFTRDPSFNVNRIDKYVRSTDTWQVLLDNDTGQPQIAHAYDFISDNEVLADNRKRFKVIRRNNKTLIFYRRTDTTNSYIAYYNETDDIITNIRSESHAGVSYMPYSMDFVIDARSDGIYVYSFVVRLLLSGANFNSATLKVFRKRVEPNGTESEIYSETFASTSNVDVYPVSVSDVILPDDRSKFYFVLEYQSESTIESGKSELCEIPKSGGSRTVLKTYNNPLLGPRSPASVNNRYFYLEGGWVRLPKSDPSDDALPDDERHYPIEGGHLIEIESNGDITDHGIVWRSRSKLDSPDPDPENPQYDGWGLHNAVVSNMVPDRRDNLRFIAGYGLPYRINNNLPSASITGAIPDETNFNWIQFGQDLSTKIASFPTNGRRGWELIQQLAQLMNWEIGFGPAMGKVDAVQAADSAITDWSANASFFFRPRTILPRS